MELPTKNMLLQGSLNKLEPAMKLDSPLTDLDKESKPQNPTVSKHPDTFNLLDTSIFERCSPYAIS